MLKLFTTWNAVRPTKYRGH